MRWGLEKGTDYLNLRKVLHTLGEGLQPPKSEIATSWQSTGS